MTEEIAANGMVEGARPELKLRPRTSGAIASIYVKENQQAAAGALLAELRNESQKQRVLLTRAELAKARATLEKIRNGERQEKRRALAAMESQERTLSECRGGLPRRGRLRWGNRHPLQRLKRWSLGRKIGQLRKVPPSFGCGIRNP